MKDGDNYEDLLVKRLRNSEELERAGYAKEPCKRCHGTGLVTIHFDNGRDHPKNSAVDCLTCRGRGFRWRGPLLR